MEDFSMSIVIISSLSCLLHLPLKFRFCGKICILKQTKNQIQTQNTTNLRVHSLIQFNIILWIHPMTSMTSEWFIMQQFHYCIYTPKTWACCINKVPAPSCYGNTIHNSQTMEATKEFITRRTKKILNNYTQWDSIRL